MSPLFDGKVNVFGKWLSPKYLDTVTPYLETKCRELVDKPFDKRCIFPRIAHKNVLSVVIGFRSQIYSSPLNAR